MKSTTVFLAALLAPPSISGQELGAVLGQVAVPGFDGAPMALAFDGTHFYLRTDATTRIVQCDLAGTLIRVFDPICPGTDPRGWLDLSFDPNGGAPVLWGCATNSGFVRFHQIDLATDDVLQTVRDLPGASSFDLDGDFDPSDGSLFYFARSLTPDQIANVSAVGAADCLGTSAVQNPARGFAVEDVVGLELDGAALWIAQRTEDDSAVARTGTSAPDVELQFDPRESAPSLSQIGDLALDETTFAPRLALWMLAREPGGATLVAFRIPRTLTQAALDILPAQWPNRIDAVAPVVQVLLLGASGFDPALVDAATVRLRRRDASEVVTAAIAPLGPGALSDAGGPAASACGAGTAADGFADLVLEFDRDELADLFEPGERLAGSEVELQLDGFLLDGTGFGGTDCLAFGWRLSASGLVPGEDFVLAVERATPGAPIFFLQSRTGGGPGVLSAGPCGLVELDLSAPITVLGAPHADAQGRASVVSSVPPGAGGASFWFQAVDLAACALTNPLVRTVERPSKVALVCEPPVAGIGRLHLVDLDPGSVRSTFSSHAFPRSAVVAPDGKLGYLTTATGHIWGFDLRRGQLELVQGANPIFVSAAGIDLALSADGRSLLTAGESDGGDPVVLVDAAAHVETAALSLFHSMATVDIGADGTGVVSGGGPLVAGRLFGLELAPGGELEWTGAEAVERVHLGVTPTSTWPRTGGRWSRSRARRRSTCTMPRAWSCSRRNPRTPRDHRPASPAASTRAGRATSCARTTPSTEVRCTCSRTTPGRPT